MPTLRALAACLPVMAHAASIWEVGNCLGEMEKKEKLPSASEFYQDYIQKSRPLHLPGAARAMPAFHRWSDEYLERKWGKETLDQVETEKKETRTKYSREEWTLSKFLSEYKNSSLYAVATLPEGLGEEVYLLPMMNCGGHHRSITTSFFWMSSGGTKSVIHQDPQENLHCIFAGEKRWIFWNKSNKIDRKNMGWVNAEEEAERNEEFKEAYGSYVGKIDVDDVDLEKYPGWGKLDWLNLTLRAGDCVYVPGDWYHYVEAPKQRSISVHVWFQKMEKFHQKSCDALERRGIDPQAFLTRVRDCTFQSADDEEVTKCRISKTPLPTVKDEL